MWFAHFPVAKRLLLVAILLSVGTAVLLVAVVLRMHAEGRSPRRLVLVTSFVSMPALVVWLAFLSWWTTAAHGDGMVWPHALTVKVQDAQGRAVTGWELSVVQPVGDEAQTPPVGNWRGPGSLVAGSTGEVDFLLESPRPFGFDAWRLFWVIPIVNMSRDRLRVVIEGVNAAEFDIGDFDKAHWRLSGEGVTIAQFRVEREEQQERLVVRLVVEGAH